MMLQHNFYSGNESTSSEDDAMVWERIFNSEYES